MRKLIYGLCAASCLGCGTKPSNRAFTQTAPTYRTISRDQQLDRLIDRMVEEQWRPMPGGNSKEDAARIAKDFAKCKTWEELDAAIEFHQRGGR